jgi:hypothetical protein
MRYISEIKRNNKSTRYQIQISIWYVFTDMILIIMYKNDNNNTGQLLFQQKCDIEYVWYREMIYSLQMHFYIYNQRILDNLPLPEIEPTFSQKSVWVTCLFQHFI